MSDQKDSNEASDVENRKPSHVGLSRLLGGPLFCPFCNCVNVTPANVLVDDEGVNDYSEVFCPECHARGPKAMNDHEEAISLWNQRPIPPHIHEAIERGIKRGANPHLTDDERRVLDAVDVAPILGTDKERLKQMIGVAVRLLRQKIQMRAMLETAVECFDANGHERPGMTLEWYEETNRLLMHE